MRYIPTEWLQGAPCSVVAMACADYARTKEWRPQYDEYFSKELDGTGYPSHSGRHAAGKACGYLSLDGFNRLVRAHFPVQKKVYYNRANRVLLKDYLTMLDQAALICVKGHFIYADKKDYWSFFDNANDPVVCVWLLK